MAAATPRASARPPTRLTQYPSVGGRPGDAAGDGHDDGRGRQAEHGAGRAMRSSGAAASSIATCRSSPRCMPGQAQQGERPLPLDDPPGHRHGQPAPGDDQGDGEGEVRQPVELGQAAVGLARSSAPEPRGRARHRLLDGGADPSVVAAVPSVETTSSSAGIAASLCGRVGRRLDGGAVRRPRSTRCHRPGTARRTPRTSRSAQATTVVGPRPAAGSTEGALGVGVLRGARPPAPAPADVPRRARASARRRGAVPAGATPPCVESVDQPVGAVRASARNGRGDAAEHAGDEDGEDQAAHRPEARRRVVLQPATGEERAGPPAHAAGSRGRRGR